ncbi:fibrobacter succinogenes major paralogous domain-containing protein [uncultured Fibrobacter sp.]|uniref:fibrobacter succinogenes major paralogous domain-containing protein n=1 Tax=uncultured Fibrobacter sp. TaxID=261512 RepID=UPI0025F5508C|nr:fibrobacter succinogenes major paralogous domain-containing protein [uncultured Fibrobacter sp.]
MSRFFVGLALWALLLALAACGGDSKGTDPARDAELAEMVDTVVSTFDDLTVCTDKREGSTAYVEDEKKAYVCESKRWTVNDSLTESIQNKDSDSAQDAESGEDVDTVVPTFDDLPACTGDLNGKTAYVEDEDSAYVCKKGLWVVDDSLTKAVRPDLEEKSSSSAKAKSSSNETSDSSSKAKSSSSKEGKSSSSDEKNSSSSFDFSAVPLASPCKTATEDNCEYGTLTDDRDGQTYKTVKIGEQWWMAENLNYRYIQQTYNGGEGDSSSYCYDNDPANCEKYGRLYLWSAAMDSAGIISDNTANGCGYGEICNHDNVKVRGVCPEGWHLPDTTEWNALFNAVGGGETAGIMLKSTEGWYSKGNGSDAYSFSALPAGYRDYDGNYDYEGPNADFWSSTEYGSSLAYFMFLYYCDDNAYLYGLNKGHGFSVRCLKD